MRHILLVVLALALGSCTGKRPIEALSIHNYLDASVATAEAHKRYASLYPGAIEPIDRGAVRVRGPQQVGRDLLTTVNVQWNGPLVDLVKAAARSAGYRTLASGERSGAPIIVTLNWRHIPLIAVLREAFGQSKGLARLEIDPSARVMTMVFARPEKSPVPHLGDSRL